MKNLTEIIRVGEKNNYNFTDKEYHELSKYAKPNREFFVNSNSKVKIVDNIPSIITINPDLDKFIEPRGDLSRVKACRVKVLLSSIDKVNKTMDSAIKYCNKNNIPALLTFQRFRSKASLAKFTGVILTGNAKDDKNSIQDSGYVYNSGYYRPTKSTQEFLIHLSGINNAQVCDKAGTGCPDCMLCSKLTHDITDCKISSLNLSVSGKKDSNGRRGLCKFNCPDCWAKIVTYGKSPACDKIIQNRKQRGEISHI